MNQEGDLCWFHGKVSRDSADQIIKDEGSGSDGTFLVRESNTSSGDYVLSVLHNAEVWHYQIRRHGEDAFFSIDDQTPIHGLDSLVEHYRSGAHGLVTQLLHMVKRDPPPHDSRSHGRTNLLHRATKEGDFTIVSELLKCGYRNIDAKNQDGQTAVHLACLYATDGIIQKLIDSGANVNCRDKDGNTPLHYACRNQTADVITILIDAKANMQARNNGTGCVPLHDAAENGNFPVVKQLLELGAPHMPRSTSGEFPADFAREQGHIAIAEYLESYVPPTPNVHKYQWYHGTLDRAESNQIVLQYATNPEFKEYNHVDAGHNELTNLDEAEDSSGIFLVRFSKHNGDNVLTLLYNKSPKNFIIQKSSKYIYIDEGPYMLSLEHLIEHYMRFSDGLPINLRYPVPPKPKPPLPLFTTIPRNNRNKGLRPSAAASPPNASILPLQSLDDITHMATIHHHSERKISADGFHATSRTQRNLSIPSDELMNHIGIFSTSPSKDQILHHQQQLQQSQQVAASPPDGGSSKKKSTSDILNFRSLKLPKKNIIKDGMKSLKKSKSPKDSAKAAGTPKSVAIDAVHTEEISQSLRNLTFSSDFKANESTYNVPTNNCAVADIQSQQQLIAGDNNGGSAMAPASLSSIAPPATATMTNLPNDNDDYFTKCDKTFLGDLNDNAHDKNNIVEEIYFVDAPTKIAAPIANTFNYVAFKQVPYFPDGSSLVISSDHVNNNSNNDASKVAARLSSTASINSNESELIMALQSQPNESSTTSSGSGYRYKRDNCPPSRPNYYIPKGSIILNEVLGEGEFGSVYKGTMLYEAGIDGGSASEVKVAIKTLHDEHCKENRAEFLREASVMIKLSHHCIVKLLGISKGPPLMIIQELVSLGSLLNYLIENQSKINSNFELKIWASQIACGMNYLESQLFVHRDLAARNILLSSRHQAKISDFGLSRALCAENNYYQASQGGKWPIKWYAPESYNYGTFSHASDVWSFGVTLWEMFSFGQPPYGDMKGVDVIQMVDAGQRLIKPDACPDNVFHIMESCWNYSPKDRPTFRHLTDFFSNDPDYQNLVELIKTENIY